MCIKQRCRNCFYLIIIVVYCTPMRYNVCRRGQYPEIQLEEKQSIGPSRGKLK